MVCAVITRSRTRGLILAVLATMAVLVVGYVAAFAALDKDEGPTPEELISQHDCPWSNAALVDVIYPGHVVVTDESGETRYAGRETVELALDQDIGGRYHGLTVHAYCR